MPSPAASQRLAWPDVAKGLSIIGVVVLHISITVPDAHLTWLFTANTWLDPLRMPLFFLVSGYFSKKIFHYSLWELFSRRLWFFIVPYCTWVPVELWTNSVHYSIVFGDEPRTFTDYAVSLLLGHNMGWFLHALVLFNLYLWAVRRLPRWAAIFGSLVPVLFLGWHEEVYFVGKALMYLPIFVIGAFCRQWITNFAELIDAPLRHAFTARVRPPKYAVLKAIAPVLGSAGGFVAGYSLVRWWNGIKDSDIVVDWYLPGADWLGGAELWSLVRLGQHLLMFPAAIAGAVLLSYVPGVSHLLRFIGRHTLPVYLGHPIALTLGFGLLTAYHPVEVMIDGAWPWENTWFWILYCLVISAVGALALWALGKVPVLGWSMKPPQIYRGATSAHSTTTQVNQK